MKFLFSFEALSRKSIVLYLILDISLLKYLEVFYLKKKQMALKKLELKKT